MNLHRRVRPVDIALAVAAVVALVAALVVLISDEGGSGSDEAGGPTTPAPAAPGAVRDVYQHPFAWNSIWNLPLSTAAVRKPFPLRSQQIYADEENISLNANDPVKTVRAPGPPTQVHVLPVMDANGKFNNCSTFLAATPDRRTIVQGEPLKLQAGGDPSWTFSFPAQSLTGDGTTGCHGGSDLSGLGGSLRPGEIGASTPIAHALKIDLNCEVACSPTDEGFRWPAIKADKDHETFYRGVDPDVKMGSLLTLPPSVDLTQFTQPDVHKIAQALQTYGAYVVDSTGGPETNAIAMDAQAEPEVPNLNSPQMHALFTQLAVVTNNTAQTPGGGPLGSPRLAPCAGPFTDGTGGSPPGC